MPSGPPARCANILFRRPILFSSFLAIRTDQEVGVEIGEKLEKEIEEKGILSLTEEKEPASRGEVVNKVIAERTKKRDATFQGI